MAISTQTAARLLAMHVSSFDNAGTSRHVRPAPAVPGIGWSITLILIAAAIVAFAL